MLLDGYLLFATENRFEVDKGDSLKSGYFSIGGLISKVKFSKTFFSQIDTAEDGFFFFFFFWYSLARNNSREFTFQLYVF